jgi:hypothetical protein
MITIVKGDGWHGLYNDFGELVAEGHQLTYEDICDALGAVLIEKTPDQEWLEENGRLPKKLDDVRLAKN